MDGENWMHFSRMYELCGGISMEIDGIADPVERASVIEYIKAGKNLRARTP